MDGRVIMSLFRESPDPEPIDTYEIQSDDDGIHKPELTENSWVAHEIVENLAALGAVDFETESAIALETCTQQRWLNLAELYYSLERYTDALGAYRKLGEMDDSSSRIPIVNCLIDLKRFDEARGELEGMSVRGLPETAPVLFLWARLFAEEGDPAQARLYLEKTEALDPTSLTVPVGAGWLALRLRQYRRALRIFEHILDRNPEVAQAHDGLGVAMLRLGRVEESIFHHMQSVSLLYHRSGAHSRLGEALVAAGQIDWASRAFRIALELDPKNAYARKSLAQIERFRGSSST
jgi:tetratricopeptide (TPR) repeat protein